MYDNNNQIKQQTPSADRLHRLDRHKDLCKYLTETYEKKNADYDNSFGDMFAELGVITAVTRIGDKYNRIKNIVKNQTTNLTDENTLDTLFDMANYCIMTIIEIERQKNEKSALFADGKKIYIKNYKYGGKNENDEKHI